MSSIKFTDLLNLPEEKISKLKLIFNSDWNYVPEEHPEEVRKKLGGKERQFELLKMYGGGEADLVRESVKTHNPAGRKRFANGDFVLCFIPYAKEDWLLVSAYKVLDSDKYLIDVDESAFSEFSSYLGRLVITWKDRKTMNIVMRDKDIISQLTIKTILEEPYYEAGEVFPGYENVNLSWRQMNYLLETKTWKTALENQKGVYLITDTKTGKRYVGSASGDEMILGGWKSYAKNGHGGNQELRKITEELGFDYVKENFRYSILEIYKSTTDTNTILARENWWKVVLLARDPRFGYNAN